MVGATDETSFVNSVEVQGQLAQHQTTFTTLQALCFEPFMLTPADEDDRRALIRAWNSTVAQASAQINASDYPAAQAITNHLKTFIMAMQQAYLKAQLVLHDAMTTRYAPLSQALGHDQQARQQVFQHILLSVLTPLAQTIKDTDPAQLNEQIARLTYDAIIMRANRSWYSPTWQREKSTLWDTLICDLTAHASDFSQAFITCMELKQQITQPTTTTDRFKPILDALGQAIAEGERAHPQAPHQVILYYITLLTNEQVIVSTLASLPNQTLRNLYAQHLSLTQTNSFKQLITQAPSMIATYLALTSRFFKNQPTDELFRVDLTTVGSLIKELHYEHSKTNMLTAATSLRDLLAELTGTKFPANHESPMCQVLSHMLHVINNCARFGDATPEDKSTIEQIFQKKIQNNDWVKWGTQAAKLAGAAGIVPLFNKALEWHKKRSGTAQLVKTPEPGTATIEPAQPPTPEQAQPVPG